MKCLILVFDHPKVRKEKKIFVYTCNIRTREYKLSKGKSVIDPCSHYGQGFGLWSSVTGDCRHTFVNKRSIPL